METKTRMLLISLLANENVVLSWGITNIEVDENRVSFDVSGFLFQGHVTIKEDTSGYCVLLNNTIVMKSLQLDDVIPKLDQAIECDSDYPLKIAEWLNRM